MTVSTQHTHIHTQSQAHAQTNEKSERANCGRECREWGLNMKNQYYLIDDGRGSKRRGGGATVPSRVTVAKWMWILAYKRAHIINSLAHTPKSVNFIYCCCCCRSRFTLFFCLYLLICYCFRQTKKIFLFAKLHHCRHCVLDLWISFPNPNPAQACPPRDGKTANSNH